MGFVVAILMSIFFIGYTAGSPAWRPANGMSVPSPKIIAPARKSIIVDLDGISRGSNATLHHPTRRDRSRIAIEEVQVAHVERSVVAYEAPAALNVETAKPAEVTASEVPATPQEVQVVAQEPAPQAAASVEQPVDSATAGANAVVIETQQAAEETQAVLLETEPVVPAVPAQQ